MYQHLDVCRLGLVCPIASHGIPPAKQDSQFATPGLYAHMQLLSSRALVSMERNQTQSLKG